MYASTVEGNVEVGNTIMVNGQSFVVEKVDSYIYKGNVRLQITVRKPRGNARFWLHRYETGTFGKPVQVS